mmetsp:Transcript_62978/g.168603  ORF Transcript_62978/g.168603 Transcript_62978/m.168603 type:complete len:82 (+) Transcript_62978:43-288(+)
MVCSICKKGGHNKRKCVKKKLEEAEDASDFASDLNDVADAICNGFTDEALSTAIEMGVEYMIPGSSIVVRICRGLWKLFRK